jgi:serine/threonine-protein kinase
VHHARDRVSGREVAIKVFHPHVWADAAFRARVRRERASLEALDHPNIIPIVAAGESAGSGWIVMPLARAGSLDARLAQGPVGLDEAVHILRQVASALDAAHAAGHLHRDVKPANVLLERDGHAWLADFGVTRPVGGTTTMPGQMVGTAAYMAPEVISGGRPSVTADIYGFACMAFEVLTGRRPFPDDEMASVLFAHVDRPAPAARTINPHLPQHVERALARGLAKRPTARPGSATALVDDLDASRTGAGRTLPMDVRVVRRTGRHPRLTRAGALLVAGFAVLGGSAAGLAWMGTGDAGTPPVADAPTRVAQRIPLASGSVAGTPASASAVPGLRPVDLVATATVGDGARAYAIDAGAGRTPHQVAQAVSAALGARGLSVERLTLDGPGSATVAWEPSDFLLIGHEWLVAEVPSVERGRQDVVLAVEGSDTAPMRFVRDLAAARPAAVISPDAG